MYVFPHASSSLVPCLPGEGGGEKGGLEGTLNSDDLQSGSILIFSRRWGGKGSTSPTDCRSSLGDARSLHHPTPPTTKNGRLGFEVPSRVFFPNWSLLPIGNLHKYFF